MENNLEYYLNLPYTKEVKLGSDGIWFARVRELPGCFSQGKTQEEALRMLDDAMEGWLEVELEDGETIPEPKEDEDYSGRFNTRVPQSLHHKLVEVAERDGVSLNQWINNALSEAVGISSKTKLQNEVPEVENLLAIDWRGLAKGINQFLPNVDLTNNASEFIDEVFDGWLTKNIREIQSDCDYGLYPQALEKAKALNIKISIIDTESPILQTILFLVQSYSVALEHVCGLDADAQRNQKMLLEIQESFVVSGLYEKTIKEQENLQNLSAYAEVLKKESLKK